ncbi:MAG: glycosyltransferase family 2 protein [Pseudomonadales bacterium]|nr:glycosyltransferase family 2 protein [Pseudomonadales bacterium]
MNNYCFVIPNYNHSQNIASVIDALAGMNMQIIMVDDGSDAQTKAVIQALSQRYSKLKIVTHNSNQGKGGAVQSGLRQARLDGYSHALQIDADGQHDLNDIHRLLELSQAHPEDLISGKPVYDDSVPKSRLYGRYITHFWVWIETLSFSVEDTMCGFRVYPLHQVIPLLNKERLGKRMDFDIEVMVKLYWRGVNIQFVPTKVIYAEDITSHFRPLEDNVLISWMHTRLFLRMLVRLPNLLARNQRRRRMQKALPAQSAGSGR